MATLKGLYQVSRFINGRPGLAAPALGIHQNSIDLAAEDGEDDDEVLVGKFSLQKPVWIKNTMELIDL